jgi:ribosome biogenesis GTPase
LNEAKKKQLEERLAALPKDEKRKLYKRAAVYRKSQQKPAKGRERFDDENDVVTIVRVKKQDSLDSWVLKLLEQEEPESPCSGGAVGHGVVEWVGAKSCKVMLGDETLTCSLSAAIAREQQTSIAVGDNVTVDRDRALVLRVEGRRSRLSRPDPDNANLERVIVANVDVVVITVSVKTPPLHPRLIDRYLVAIQRGGAAPLICVNKVDLLSADERASELAKLDPYVAAGVEAVACSTATHEGLAGLRLRLEGQVCAFVGHSGVGKSSLLNALHPGLGLFTNSVSEGYGRGRHTTTSSSLYDLGGGTRLIDTPGIRSFGLWESSPTELAWYFPEFAAFAGSCRFSDCTHSHEPICGVKAAAASGGLSAARYDTYLRLLNG